jgi:hypothetical protein
MRVASRVKFSYDEGEDGQQRPYLWLNLKGETGSSIRVRGLFDSGADVSLLAGEYSEALGLRPDDLKQAVAEGPAGLVTVLRSKKVIQASLPGAPDVVVPLYPLFVPGGSGAHWGRDFMAVYAVAFDERAQQFSLFGPELSVR